MTDKKGPSDSIRRRMQHAKPLPGSDVFSGGEALPPATINRIISGERNTEDLTPEQLAERAKVRANTRRHLGLGPIEDNQED